MASLAPVDQRSGVSARDLVRRNRRPGQLTAAMLETWLLRVGFAEAAGDGALLPTKLGAAVGASLDGAWRVRDL